DSAGSPAVARGSGHSGSNHAHDDRGQRARRRHRAVTLRSSRNRRGTSHVAVAAGRRAHASLILRNRISGGIYYAELRSLTTLGHYVGADPNTRCWSPRALLKRPV